MSFKDILVHIDSSKHCGTRLQVAAALARGFGAHLTGLYVMAPMNVSPFLADQFRPEVLDEMHARAAQQRDRARELFDDITSRRQPPADCEWIEVRGDPVEAVTMYARYADFAVLGQVDPAEVGHGARFDLPEHVVTAAGRPILMVPYAGTFEGVGERVLVAWNSSAQAARAIHDALPLLARAKRVLIMAVHREAGGQGQDDVPGADIARHLVRHGVAAEASPIDAGGIEVGDLLLSRAADEGADLLVMGIYGHSRLRELVLGGVSRHLFDHMTIPIFMAH